MKLVIDIVLLIIVALCTWQGFRKGLVAGIASIIAIVIALFGATILSSAYSHEVVPVLKPFVGSYIDSQKTRDAVLEEMGYKASDLSLEDIISQDSSLRYDYAYESFLNVGFFEKRAEELSEKTVEYAADNDVGMTEAVIEVLCDTITYVGGLVIGFLLILIILVVLGNIINLSFRLPNMELVDDIGGTVIGFVQGVIYCALFCWLLSFFGLIIGRDTMSDALLTRFFLSLRFITNGLL